MYCAKCHKQIDNDSLYCIHCGHKIKRCSKCHNLVEESDQFCSQCGNHLLNQETPITNNYHPIGNRKPIIQERTEGYYQPLKDVKFEEKIDDGVVFEDIPQTKKVDFKVIGICFSVLVIFTIVGYVYLNNGKNPNMKDTPEVSDKVIQNDMIINSTTTSTSGNLNMEGTAFFDGKMLYVCDDNGYIVKMDSKLENRVTLVRQKSQYLNVVNDTIYYTNEKNNLCSVSTDGKNQTVILNKTIFYLVVIEDKAYYQLDEGEGVGEYICVYDLKTNKQTKLNNRASYNLNIIKDKIYYSSTDGIYSMNIDGKGEEKIVSGKVTNAIVQDNKIYYGQEDKGTISYYDISTKKIEDLITKDNMYLLNITEQYLFYLNNDGNVLRYDLKSKDIKKVYYSGIASDLQIVGDKIIVTVKGQQYNNKNSYKVIMDFDGNTQQRLFTESDGSFI